MKLTDAIRYADMLAANKTPPQEYYEEHPVMYLYVPGNRYTLETAAAGETQRDRLKTYYPEQRKTAHADCVSCRVSREAVHLQQFGRTDEFCDCNIVW